MTSKQREEMLGRAREANRWGLDAPAGPVTSFPQKPPSSVPEGIFAPEDLLKPVQRAEPFTMPNGKSVWVHPVSPDEAVWLNVQTVKDLQRVGEVSEAEARIRALTLAWSYQAVCACRVGPEPNAARVFHPDHAEALRKNLPNETLQQIAALSDRLGSADAASREVVRGFFDALRTWLTTCSSQLSTDTLGTWRERLEACASCVSLVSARGMLIPTDADALSALLNEE